ncbi:MAG TPA: hypothetical protein PLD14_02630 [Candidatus Pacearchaeota archaeon]|nr:hypothetical protein [Candidatus Pacearchaeota archaeon]HPR80097.1 hypothetical protein [Candidatus Pacearchaeota archaeon]
MLDLLIKKDVELMEKYEKGRSLDEQDRKDVERLCRIGWMKMGVILEGKITTTKTIELGLKILNDARSFFTYNLTSKRFQVRPIAPAKLRSLIL